MFRSVPNDRAGMKIAVRKSAPSDNETLARLHTAVFPGFFLSTLGVGFLTVYYRVVLRHPETICLFAEDESGRVCGYVVGRTHAAGYLKRIVRSAPLTFGWQASRLLFTRPKALLRLLNNLDKKRDDSQVSDPQEYAEIGLIGVLPQYKGQGIGRRLFGEFEAELKTRDVRRLSLTTDAENNADTLRAYRAWGFEVYYPFTSYPDRKMYRLIKNL